MEEAASAQEEINWKGRKGDGGRKVEGMEVLWWGWGKVGGGESEEPPYRDALAHSRKCNNNSKIKKKNLKYFMLF